MVPVVLGSNHGSTIKEPWFYHGYMTSTIVYHGTSKFVPWYSMVPVVLVSNHGTTMQEPWYYHGYMTSTMVLPRICTWYIVVLNWQLYVSNHGSVP